MKTIKLVMLVILIAVALFILAPNLSWAAEDGAVIYKAKCAVCHGADAAGSMAPLKSIEQTAKFMADVINRRQREIASTLRMRSGRGDRRMWE